MSKNDSDRVPYRPRLLDLFSCAGGMGMGYYQAGFEVVGVDIAPQPNYPFEFHQGDALDVLRRLIAGDGIKFRRGDETRLMYLIDFAAIHASPPCQAYLNLGAVNRALGREYDWPDLIGPTRELLIASGKPYVIENVQDARKELVDPVRICGTGLGLPLRRHRLFESNMPLVGIACDHKRFSEKKYWTGRMPNGKRTLSTVVQVYGNAGGRDEWPAAMGIDWMTPKEMTEAVPPAYAEHIGLQLLEELAVGA